MKQFFRSNKSKIMVLALIPFLYCMVYCLVQGRSILDVYLPASDWNDELFYYKQVESILGYGIPQGYFGYNESHALRLSFAAWSPMLVLPWVLWGYAFGWNFLSPIFCNILLMTVAMVVFAVCIKPTWKQVGVLATLFAAFTPFVRYMLSGMPEVICFSALIVFYSLAFNYLQTEKKAVLVCMMILAIMMTLMRPYMILFMLLPAYFLARRCSWKGIVSSVLLIFGTLVVYFSINHFYGAEYFVPLFDLKWMTTFFESGLFGGLHNLISTLYWNGINFLGHMKDGILYGQASGAFFTVYLVLMTVLVFQSIKDFVQLRKVQLRGCDDEESVKAKEEILRVFAIEIHLAFSFFGMLIALLLMYDLKDGSKHFLIFIAAAVYVLSVLRTKYFLKTVTVVVVCVYFFVAMATNPYDYQVPFKTDEIVEQMNAWKKVYSENIIMSDENVPSYENDVIWTFSDFVRSDKGGDVVSAKMKWQLLYVIPEGMAISCCMSDYLVENFEELQSRYLVTLPGGQIDSMCAEAGYEEITRDEDIVFYKRY